MTSYNPTFVLRQSASCLSSCVRVAQATLVPVPTAQHVRKTLSTTRWIKGSVKACPEGGKAPAGSQALSACECPFGAPRIFENQTMCLCDRSEALTDAQKCVSCSEKSCGLQSWCRSSGYSAFERRVHSLEGAIGRDFQMP